MQEHHMFFLSTSSAIPGRQVHFREPVDCTREEDMKPEPAKWPVDH